MTTKEVAERMNGRQYLREITREEEAELKKEGIIVAFGYSDDNVELCGAIDEEIGGYDEFEIDLFNGEVFSTPCMTEDCEIEDCQLYKMVKNKIAIIHVTFSNNGWEFQTDIPHEEFSIMEDGELFGKGIAFYQKDCRR